MNNKQLQLVTFEQAKKLKAAGFDSPCKCAHSNDGELYAVGKCDTLNIYGRENSAMPNAYSAPTVALALKWLRDVKVINSEAYVCRLANGMFGGYVHGWDDVLGCHRKIDGDFETYEAAESALLDSILKLLEK